MRGRNKLRVRVVEAVGRTKKAVVRELAAIKILERNQGYGEPCDVTSLSLSNDAFSRTL